jgi:hypothetical protein
MDEYTSVKFRAVFSTDRFLSERSLEEIKELIQLSHQFRRKEVELLIDAICEPESHLTADGSKTLKQELIDQIRRQQDKTDKNEADWFDALLP